MKEGFSILIEKFLKGECNEDEIAEIELWYRSFDEKADHYQEGPSLDIHLDDLYQRIHATLSRDEKPFTLVKKLRISWRKVSVAAALFFVILSLGIYIYTQNKNHQPQMAEKLHSKDDVVPGHEGAVLTLANGKQVVLDSAGNGIIASQDAAEVVKKNGCIVYNTKSVVKTAGYNTLSTPKGRLFALILPDGSKVWLNAQASIRYPIAFNGNTRDVEMTGEAYFEVAHNPSKPFRVKVGGVQVQVLGTHFNINAYSDEPAVKATLLQGSIAIGAEGTQVRKIVPGTQAVVVGKSIHVEYTDVDQSIAWKNGAFVFDNKNIKEVLRQLARWYNVEVIYEGGNSDVLFSGQIGRDLNLSQVLTGLESMHIHFKIEGNKLKVLP